MALLKTGLSLFKTLRPTAVNPVFVIPSTLEVQSRNAARKGYREKAKLQRKKLKMSQEAVKKTSVPVYRRQSVAKYVKTVERSKPDLPNDDIIIVENFKYMKFSLSEAVKLHREYHHPTICNNPEASVHLSIEFNMTAKKLTQVMKPFSGVAAIPHPFIYKHKKEVLVFCPPDLVELALNSGASMAGGEDLVKKVQGGVIIPSIYDYVICHVDFLQELTPIRGLLKNQLPKLKLGTLTVDLKSAIHRFLHGVEYSCVKYGPTQNFGVSEVAIGTINMDLEHLEENLKALLKDIMSHKPAREGEFISWIWCSSPPSNEKFSLDLSKYIESSDSKEDFDDDDDEDEDEYNEKKELKKEQLQIKQLKEQLEM